MAKHSRSHGADLVIEPNGLAGLIGALQRRGFQVIAPVLRDSAINWQPVESADDLPRAWTAKQSPGMYRVEPREDDAYFGYAVGPASLKRYLHTPEAQILAVESNGNPFHILENRDQPARRAFIGVRACDIAAVERLDRVLLEDRYPDILYRRNRESIFLVAVSCTDPSSSCFCTSMGTGPEVQSGYDLLLTEVMDAGAHHFTVRAGSEHGREVMAELEHRPASEEVSRAAAKAIAAGRAKITRRLDTAGLREALYDHFEHPEWERVAAKCYGCGNCTQVCPTCFCVTVEDSSDVDGRRAERTRKWDSCFTLSYSYIHGGSVRQSAKARFRQWVTHKFAAWHDQFGTSGCSGCGRCITWCPAGIDVTEVAATVHGAARGGGGN